MTYRIRRTIESRNGSYRAFSYACYAVEGEDYNIATWVSTSLNSTLDILLSHVFYNGRPVSQDLVVFLKIIFSNKEKYSYWLKGYDIYKKQGRKATIKWMREIAPVLKLRNKLEGRD